ncbi:hypothetical protein Tcan_06001 [Toxocara canis]|uniref:Uncharacterized protein n=1 Tax=Toxocara canis TaxID=6265 RepID=A0A0B2VJT6_TOXCA|nr:hypothetical protein Tcan_06001 [Toxocara canis]
MNQPATPKCSVVVSARIPVNECRHDLVAPPCAAASSVRSRPRSISFETFSEPTSGSNDFCAYQHIDLSPDSLKSLKDSPQRRSCSAACATGTDLIFLARSENCALCKDCMANVKLSRSVSVINTSTDEQFSVAFSKRFRHAVRKLQEARERGTERHKRETRSYRGEKFPEDTQLVERRTNWVTLYLKTLGKANAKEEWSLLGEKELLYGVFEDADQFFETINPLNGFEGKESLETYMWEQSLKVEPKDAEKLDNVKPSRPPNVLKSPGIKPPKTLSSVVSSSGPSNHYAGYRSSGRGFSTAFNTYSPGMFNEPPDVSSSGPSNHYAGYRSSGRGFSTAFNTYSPGMFNEPPDTPRCFAENASQMEEKNSHLGMVEINPGYQPRYLGDARRGEVSPLTPLPNLATPPPLIPRLRKEKARSGPPSPLSNIISSCSKSNEPSHSPPPPLYPRRTSPHFFPSPIPPPPPFRAPSVTSCTAPTSPLSPPSSSAPTERAESFVFPPNSSMDENRTLLTEAGASHAGCSNAPAVPPRRKGDALPAPLPLDAVRVVWSGEASPGTPLVTAVLPLPPSFDNDAPPLYPRRLVNVEPPPRPPKKNKQRCLASASTNTAYMESSGSESPPPPLPPKTYKRQQRRS